ncbi:hypothetical protein RI129_009387 [Pyrocoelia pectoralis]|uniref:Cytochrome P450 n=1 Tax=Pyrocoelia pectoralis TaxID=417401 RepID=A0AAN7V1T3_9COLE
MWSILIALLIIILIALYWDTRKPKNFPPGPKWFPIIGCAWQLHYLHQRKGSLAKAIQELSLQYGSVVGARIGRRRTVFVCGVKTIKELYTTDELNGRPDDISTKSRTLGKRRGIVAVDSKIFLEQKRIVLKILKEHWFRREILGNVLEQEVRTIIADIEKKIVENPKMCVNNLFGVHVVTSLYSLLTGHETNNDNEDIKELNSAMESFSQNISLIGTVFTHFPFLRHICPDACGYNLYVNIHKRIITLLSKKVKELKVANGYGFISAYLKMLDFGPNFSEDQLVAISLDILIGGYDTTCNMLGFAFLYMLLHPDVQAKVQEEIDRVVGRERLPTLDDRPRGTLDENSGWENPKAFNPERFMKDGRLTIPNNFIQFGLGKRRCLGEVHARTNIFLIIASLLQKFNFKAIPENLPLLDIFEGFTPSVKPFKALVTLR